MPQRDRLGLDQATNGNEAEPVVLEVAIDPLDKLAKAEDLLAGLRCHPAAPLLHAVGLPRPLAPAIGPRPLAPAIGPRPRADVVPFGRHRRKYLDGACRMDGPCRDVLAGGVMGIDQKVCWRRS